MPVEPCRSQLGEHGGPKYEGHIAQIDNSAAIEAQVQIYVVLMALPLATSPDALPYCAGEPESNREGNSLIPYVDLLLFQGYDG